jgi:signal transduction histidine kinase
MKLFYKKSSLNLVWIHLWVGIALAILVLGSGIWIIHNDIQSRAVDGLKQQHTINQSRIDEFQQTQSHILRSLSEHIDPSLFYHFLKADTHIMQIRFIDLNGDEKIRFDRLRDGTLRQIPSNELQNKADRYYFRQFAALSENMVDFSELDLNIEHGTLDTPFNPTLRAGIAVYKNGVKIGIIVINYYMQEWIQNLKSNNVSTLYLIDQDGYFLIHPEPSWSWSRYRSSAKSAAEYFRLSPSRFSLLNGEEYRWIDEDTVAFSLDLYGQKLLALYQPKVSPRDILIRRLFQFGLIILVSLLFIVIPLIEMVRFNLRRFEEERTKNNIILVHQSKLEAMGDMLGAIAHQWRQPLNSVGLIMQDLVSAFNYRELDKEYLKRSEKGVMEQLLFMSQTIDAFRNFFADDKKEESCNLIEIVMEIRTLFLTQLHTHEIILEVMCSKEGETVHPCQDESETERFNLNSYPALIKQILLSLITNAKEALEHSSSNRTITLTLYSDKDTLRIDVSDKAGGINPLIAKRIFEPYYTTKEMGTGLGLTIAHTLAKQHLQGDLILQPQTEKGVCTFTLSLPRFKVFIRKQLAIIDESSK